MNMDTSIFRAKIINDTKLFDEYELKNGQFVVGYLQKWLNNGKTICYIWTQETYRYEVDEKTIGQFICNDENNNKVWSNSRVIYNNKNLGFEYSVNGWYLKDGILFNFDENEIQVVLD